ncbi:hypothetical protein Hc94105_0634 [Helicobacter cinaedi]|uniref:molecular chaperone TorD family protein n=1 Tax=Helicobacter cinaedi TaxID=213 RepID=UPI001F441E94|nr:molecular chaperone TorD family protein [Helicobacter cinaedi]BDB66442.1 hypothetical protein Hc94105_0634 [Helicobacter cinaedi]
MPQNNVESLAKARALYYDFFAGLFLYELLSERGSVLLEQIRILKENSLNESDKVHFELLESEITHKGIKGLLDEYTRTFILPFDTPLPNTPMPQRKRRDSNEMESNIHSQSVGRVMLYLSHYTEGCLNGKSLLKARGLTKQSTFRLNSKECKESEEHLGFLLLLMRHLLLSNDENDKSLSIEVANELVLPLGEYVSKALQQREDLSYYASVGELLKSFLQVESALL